MRDYDHSDLKDLASDAEHKAAMLEVLLAFDKFCDEHNLTYYLSGGTLLGAIRHKGFIPWDDDIDVNMPRPDCERLMELSGGRIGDYEFMPPNSSSRYFAYHWKLYSSSILIAKRRQGGVGDKVYPIFLDIFPIDGLPDTEEENIEHYAEIRRRKNRVSLARNARRYRGSNPYRKLRNRAARFVYRLQGVDPLFDKVTEHAKSRKFEDSEYVGVMMTNVHTTEERVVKSEYAPVVRMEFEGHLLSCPAGYDTYLRQLYGPNYMNWLPVHKRVPRHDFVTFIPYGPGEKPRALDEQPEDGDRDLTATDDDDMQDEMA
ncbi:MAG: LicD family protein [Microbacterium sp.]|uniref:LicD family protein n=1 Tax=Microbacterium sp. TaxID=51671 RepID=UPI0039E57193